MFLHSLLLSLFLSLFCNLCSQFSLFYLVQLSNSSILRLFSFQIRICDKEIVNSCLKQYKHLFLNSIYFNLGKFSKYYLFTHIQYSYVQLRPIKKVEGVIKTSKTKIPKIFSAFLFSDYFFTPNHATILANSDCAAFSKYLVRLIYFSRVFYLPIFYYKECCKSLEIIWTNRTLGITYYIE